MFIFKRENDFYYYKEGKTKRSLKTKNLKVARALFKEVKIKRIKNTVEFFKKKEKGLPILQVFGDYINKRTDLSDKTIIHDKFVMKLFVKLFGDKPINEITEIHIEKLKNYCFERKAKNVSVNSYLRQLKAFFNFCYENKILQNPLKIKLLKTEKALPKVLNPDELNTILNYTRQNYFEYYRMIIFALYTGCRLSEVLNLKYKDIQKQGIDQIVFIKGKGNKERTVLLLPEVLKILNFSKNEEDLVFMKKPTSNFTVKFHQIVLESGLKRGSFHSFRHTAATQMLASGIRLEVVQKILGHSDIKTTQIYAQLFDNVKNAEMKKLNYNPCFKKN